jgi:hypothetical protein
MIARNGLDAMHHSGQSSGLIAPDVGGAELRSKGRGRAKAAPGAMGRRRGPKGSIRAGM